MLPELMFHEGNVFYPVLIILCLPLLYITIRRLLAENEPVKNFTSYDVSHEREGIFLLEGKHWDEDVDHENGYFDYLIRALIEHAIGVFAFCRFTGKADKRLSAISTNKLAQKHGFVVPAMF